MSKRQETTDQILKWIELIHKRERLLYRYIHRNDDWRYSEIDGIWVPEGDAEYHAVISCSNCGGSNGIYAKKGVELSSDLLSEVTCQKCGVVVNVKKRS